MVYEIKSYKLFSGGLETKQYELKHILAKLNNNILLNIQTHAKLIYNMFIEGDIGVEEISIIEALLDEYKIPYHNFYLIHNIFNIPNCKFNQFYYNRHFIRKAIQTKKLFNENLLNKNELEKRYKFHIPIRRFAKHRVDLLESLFLNDNTFIENNLVSFNVNWDNNRYALKGKNKKFIDFILSKKQQLIDVEITNKISGYLNEDKNTYEQSCITIVTETFFEDEYNYLSEKIWKPIAHRHPFILVGRPHSLKHLHSLGFKTFDKWWDESYDNELNSDIRLEKILTEIKKINSLHIDELSKMINEMSDIIQYNQNRLLEVDITEIENLKNDFVLGNTTDTIIEIPKFIL